MGTEIATQGNRLPTALRHDGRSLGPLAEPGEIDLRGFVRTLLRRKIMLILIVAGGIAGAELWIMRTAPRYSADALIMIESQPSRIVVVDGMPQQSGSEMVNVNTQIAVLKSRSLAAKVVDELSLGGDPEFEPNLDVHNQGRVAHLIDKAKALARRYILGEKQTTVSVEEAAMEQAALEKAGLASSVDPGTGITGQPETRDQRQRAMLINNFIGRLTVKSEDQSRLINISFESADAAKAALITNTL